MFDKGFIFLLILLIVSGAAAYDRYLTSRGEISPVAQLLDFTGFAKTSREKAVHQTHTTTTFQYNYQDNLDRLREKYAGIESQRAELVRRREEIIQQLIAANEELLGQAEQSLTVIATERQSFLAKFPELASLSGTSPAISNPLNDVDTQKVVGQLKILIKEIVLRLQNDPARMRTIYQELQNLRPVGSVKLPNLCLQSSV